MAGGVGRRFGNKGKCVIVKWGFPGPRFISGQRKQLLWGGKKKKNSACSNFRVCLHLISTPLVSATVQGLYCINFITHFLTSKDSPLQFILCAVTCIMRLKVRTWLFPFIHKTLHYFSPCLGNTPGTHLSSQLYKVCPAHLRSCPHFPAPPNHLHPLCPWALLIKPLWRHPVERPSFLQLLPAAAVFPLLYIWQKQHLTGPQDVLETILNSSCFKFLLFMAFEHLDSEIWWKETKKLLPSNFGPDVYSAFSPHHL